MQNHISKISASRQPFCIGSAGESYLCYSYVLPPMGQAGVEPETSYRITFERLPLIKFNDIDKSAGT
nr:MAG TPA: hypothetical protein [Caudoviricetes sp.]